MKRENTNLLMGILSGAVIGGLSALLFAPNSGEETRKKIKSTAQQTTEKARDIGQQAMQRAQDMGEKVSHRAGDIKEKVKDTARRGRHSGSAMLGMIDINRASRDELMTIEGISPSLADEIISFREVHGGFKSVDDLNEIADAQRVTFSMLRDKVYI